MSRPSRRALAAFVLLLTLGFAVLFLPALRQALAPPQTRLYVRCDLPETPPDLVVDPAPIRLIVSWAGGSVSANLWDHCGTNPMLLDGYPTEAPVPATVEVRWPEESLRLDLAPFEHIQADGTGRAAMIRVELGDEALLEHDSL